MRSKNLVRAGLVLFMVAVFLASSFTPALAASSVGPSTVAVSSLQCDNGGDKGCTDYPYQHKVFYDNSTNLWWSFYVFATNNPATVSCSTSSNETVWTSPVTVATYHVGQLAAQIDFYHNNANGKIYYAEADSGGSDFPNYGFWLRYGTLSSSGCGSINWSIPETGINISTASVEGKAISITQAPDGDLWVAYSQFNSPAIIVKCTANCAVSSSWVTQLTTSGITTSLAQVAVGTNSSDVFVLTGCATSSTYLGGSCTGSLSMYYTNNGGASWIGPIATKGAGYYSITMNMITVGNVAYVTMSNSTSYTASDSGYDWFAMFNTAWSTETYLQHGYGSIIGAYKNSLFIFYESAPICPVDCTNSNTQHNYTISYIESLNLGSTWTGPQVMLGPLYAFFSEGPSLSSGSAYPITSGRFGFLWTPDDSDVSFGSFAPSSGVSTTMSSSTHSTSSSSSSRSTTQSSSSLSSSTTSSTGHTSVSSSSTYTSYSTTFTYTVCTGVNQTSTANNTTLSASPNIVTTTVYSGCELNTASQSSTTSTNTTSTSTSNQSSTTSSATTTSYSTLINNHKPSPNGTIFTIIIVMAMIVTIVLVIGIVMAKRRAPKVEVQF